MGNVETENETWRDWNVNIGVLLAFLLGISTVVVTFVGIQSWLDNRIDDRIERKLSPINHRLDTIEEQFERQEERNKSRHRYLSEMLEIISRKLDKERQGDR